MKAKITTKILKTAVLIVALLALGSNVRSDVQFNVPWAGIRDQLVKQLRQDGWILVTDDRDEMNPMFTRDRSGGDWKVIDWLSCSFVPQGHGMPIRFVVEKNEVRFWNTVNGYRDVTQRDGKAVEDLVTKAVKAYWDDVNGGHHAEHPQTARQAELGCIIQVYDPQTNRWKQVLRSTFTRNKRQAQKICDAFDEAAKAAQNGTLSVDAAREIIARGVANIFATANLTALPSASIKAWCDRWVEAKAIEAEGTTHARYNGIVARFIAFLGASRASRNLASLQSDDIAKFRDREAKEPSRATTNVSVKVLRVCFGEAERQGLIASNPAKKVKTLELTSESKRRAFTLAEIKRILAACNNAEWRGLVLFGLYLGQRLGDLARLTWRSVNFETNEIAFTAKKTGSRIVSPFVQPLVDYLAPLESSDNPNAHLFLNAAKHKRTASLSNQFREILVDAGLAEARDYRTTTKGRAAQREAEISFHSLRHSAVTMLKASGLIDVSAREIVDHDSAAASRHYTHLSTDDLRNAMQRLPDVTSADT